MSVVCSQSFGMVERIVVLDLRSCHRRKVDLSMIRVLDLYKLERLNHRNATVHTTVRNANIENYTIGVI